MALSAQSVTQIADVLAEDFNVFLQTERSGELNELLADAARDFIAAELGDVDDDLYYELALQLMGGVALVSV